MPWCVFYFIDDGCIFIVDGFFLFFYAVFVVVLLFGFTSFSFLCCLFNKTRALYNYVSNFGLTDHPNKIQTIRCNYSVKIFTKFAYHLICRAIILPYRPVRCLRHQPIEISEQDVNKKRLLWSQIRQFCFFKELIKIHNHLKNKNPLNLFI